jgi:hypothetical protein
MTPEGAFVSQMPAMVAARAAMGTTGLTAKQSSSGISAAAISSPYAVRS